MILTADYHTHTIYSHGKGTVSDNAKQAKNVGLTELGITDHGFSHPAFGLKKRNVDKLSNDCFLASKEYGVKVLRGIESNIISDKGLCDLPTKLYDDFDIFLAGIHKFVVYRGGNFFNLFLPNFTTDLFNVKPAKWVVKETTKAYINTIKNSPIDVLTHLNFCCFSDAKEVAKACADYGVYLELNAKKTHLSDKDIDDVLSTDVKFIISSDAHTPSRVGEVSLVQKLILDKSFPLDRIQNIDGKTPSFRFKAFKEGVTSNY